METSALKSGSGRGGRAVLLCLVLLTSVIGAQNIQDSIINNIYIKSHYQGTENSLHRDYRKLLLLQPNDPFSLARIEESMAALYRLKSFSNIEVKGRFISDRRIDLYFICTEKYIVNRIGFALPSETGIWRPRLKEAIYLREHTYLEAGDIERSISEIKALLKSRGFFSPLVTYKLDHHPRKPLAKVTFQINPGTKTRIERIVIRSNSPAYQKKLERQLTTPYYIPAQFQEIINQTLEELKDQYYFYGEVEVQETFTDPNRSRVALAVTLRTGKKHRFVFSGVPGKEDIILPVWRKKVFEKWALRETQTRLLNHYKKRGYLQARVEVSARNEKKERLIEIAVDRGERYKLGRIFFEGNRAVAEQQLFNLIKTDNIPSNRLLWLNPSDLEVDREILQIFYYLTKGFHQVNIDIRLDYRRKKVDITFVIQENQKYTIQALIFENNQTFNSRELLQISGLRPNQIYLRKNIDDARQRITRFYLQRGYRDIQVTPKISEGNQKKIIFQIDEGPFYRMGDFIIFGASLAQEKLIRKLAGGPLNDMLDYQRFLDLREELENSTIFNDVQLIPIKRKGPVMDIILNVIPDDSEFYGIGLGVEKKQVWGIRSTVEYSKKNLFNTYFGFSSLLQVGPKETRGILVFDSPYFFGTKLNSQLRVWMENEIYPSFQFTRVGIAESLIKMRGPDSYYLASLNFTRTELTELSIPESELDRLNAPFNTATVNFSYIRENRDNPFNPVQGHYFLADLRVGLLDVFSGNRPFLKLKWNYQKNLRFLKDGVFSFTLRNGFVSNKVPITERFFGGGIYTFRGISSNELGPLTPEGEPVGGNSFLFVNFDFTFPMSIIPIKDLYYSLFFDLGNVFATTEEFDLAALDKALGLELKYQTPFGPFRVSLGYNLARGMKNPFIFFIGIGNVL